MRLCSITLSITLIVNLFPVQALGTEKEILSQKGSGISTENVQLEKNIISIASNEETEPAEIVTELEDQRTAFSKTYLMSNGLKMSVIYASAVHYQKDGEWKEIDNSLQAIGDVTTGVYTNRAGSWNIAFPQELGNGKWISVQKDNHSLEIGLAGEITAGSPSDASTITPDNMVIQSNTEHTLLQANTVRAEIQTTAPLYPRENMDYPETYVDNLGSSLQYNGVYTNTDIKYELMPGRVKESVIIHSYRSDLKGYHYVLKAENLRPELDTDNSITFYADNSEEAVMTIPAPFLIDSAGERSTDILVTLKRSGDTYLLTYQLPDAWMADASRMWPVILDPEISIISDISNIEAICCVQSFRGNPSEGALRCGRHKAQGILRTFIRMKELPALADSEIIASATLNLLCGSGTEDTTPIEVHCVKEAWTSSNISLFHSIYPLAESTVNATCNTPISMSITKIVNTWYASGNYGLVIKGTAEVWISE